MAWENCNTTYFADNPLILRTLPSDSIDLIYIVCWNEK